MKGHSIAVIKALVMAAVVLIFTGASVWEGSASLAPRGELPEEGYYVATNSFPQNTVVDITNLETGRSIRAIVSSGLNTPGLLAILSPDTASRIGIGNKTIGRIRMTQPSDPIAFSRFTEGLVASGDPDYDPQAMVAQTAAREQAEREAVPAPRIRPSAEPEAEQNDLLNQPYGYDPSSGIDYPDYADYSHNSIVTVPGSDPTPSRAAQASPFSDDWEEDWDERAYSAYLFDDEESPETTNYRVWEQGGSVGEPLAAAPQPPAQDPWTPQPDPVQTPAAVPDPVPAEDPWTAQDPWEQAWNTSSGERVESYADAQGRIIAEAQSAASSPGNESSARARLVLPAPQPAQPATPAQPAPQPTQQTGGPYLGTNSVPPPPAVADYSLIPAEERPPAQTRVEPAPGQENPNNRIDESLFIDPIEKLREDRARAEAARAAQDKRAADAARAEDARLAAERRAFDAARTEESARIAEENRRRAEAARNAVEPAPRVVVVTTPEDAGEPQGPWVGPVATPQPPSPVTPPPPEVIVKAPEEVGEPQGPWASPVEPPQPPPPAPPPEVVVKAPEYVGEPQGPWVDPIPARPAPVPEQPPVQEVTVHMPPEYPADKPAPLSPPAEIASVPPAAPAATPTAAPRETVSSSGETPHPLNVITELEKGKYYVQLGAYRSMASIESALLRIDPGYPLKVQPTGSADNPLYRLLVGPVNLGESGALVQRFKGSGYQDAYIRSN